VNKQFGIVFSKCAVILLTLINVQWLAKCGWPETALNVFRSLI